jgi:superoxide dismutase
MSDSYTLPDLRYEAGALNPHVLGRIMELHHDKHHACYVKTVKPTLAKRQEMRSKADFAELSCSAPSGRSSIWTTSAAGFDAARR